VARVAEASGVGRIRDWLAGSDISSWRLMFDASPSELADLLTFTRASDAAITGRALAGESVAVPVSLAAGLGAGGVVVMKVDEPAPARLGLFRDERLIGYVAAAVHDDMRRLIELGIPVVTDVSADLSLHVTVTDPTQRPAWFGGQA
jgi:hypothetical protein